MLNEILHNLRNRNLSGWQVRQTETSSFQSFFAKADEECERTVHAAIWSVTLHQRRPAHGGETLGLASFKLGPRDKDQIDAKIDEALFAASLVENQPFELPSPPEALPDVPLLDPSSGPGTLAVCRERLLAAVAREKGVRLSSAEFFVDRVQTRLVNHKGLDVSEDESIHHAEIILLAAEGDEEKEFITRYSRRFLKDFDLEGEVAASAEAARNATKARLPKTGRFPVLFSEEPLDNLFAALIARASARLKYNRMIQSDIGRPVVEPGEPKGDAVTLWSNGVEPGMLGSARFDSYGTPSNRVRLIEKNVLKRHLADQRYAAYLGVEPTGELGNIEIEPGSHAFDALKKMGLERGGTLYHLTAFSAFEPNAVTGAFSAEIRSGFEISSSGVRPIKGGSVSGVFQKDVLDAYLSSEQVKRERALVPKGILFGSLAIAGA